MLPWDAARPPVRRPSGVRCLQPRIVRNDVQISSSLRHWSGRQPVCQDGPQGQGTTGVAVQPVLREFSAAFGYKQYEVPYHPGTVKYFKEHNLAPKALD